MNGLGTSQPDPVMQHHHIGLLHPPHIRCVVAPGKSREGCCARRLIGAAPTGRCDGPSAWPGRWECFEGRAGRPVPAMTLSDVPHKPRPRAFAPPGHGLAISPRSLSLACLAVLRPRVPLPRYFVAAALQSTPGPWCRGGVGLLGSAVGAMLKSQPSM